MSEHKITVEKTARYFTHGSLDKATELLVVLHGYGQLPEYFIRKFSQLPEHIFVVAPEGMHRFYLKGSGGRVGASWMTKESRTDDISDNLRYLNQLFGALLSDRSYRKITLLGFSQGGATAARLFFSKRNYPIDSFILWGSVFPPDIPLPLPTVDAGETTNQSFVIGTEDEYFSDEDRKQLMEYFQSIGFKTYLYAGLHDIHAETLTKLLA